MSETLTLAGGYCAICLAIKQLHLLFNLKGKP
jgi:hypothetical protein